VRNVGKLPSEYMALRLQTRQSCCITHIDKWAPVLTNSEHVCFPTIFPEVMSIYLP
jgi:hypothetical protein